MSLAVYCYVSFKTGAVIGEQNESRRKSKSSLQGRRNGLRSQGTGCVGKLARMCQSGFNVRMVVVTTHKLYKGKISKHSI